MFRRAAEGNYTAADHAGRVLSLNNLNAGASLPFTNFAVGRAQAEQTAWQNVQTYFQSTIASINTETATYDNLVASQITGLASNSTTAQQIYIGTVAPAIETRDTAHAGAWKLYDEQSSTAEELYQQQIAQANRNHAVAIAQAERNRTATGDQTAYDNAVALTNSQLNEAKLSAARDYAIAEIGAKGGRDITLHNANTTLDAVEGTAHVTRTQDVTSAIRDAVISDAEGFRNMYLNVLSDLDDFGVTHANGRVTELTNLNTTDGTPWAGQALGKVTAERDYATTLQPINLANRQTRGNAQVDYTISEANAWHTRVNAQTEAQVTLQNEQNAAKGNRLSAEQGMSQSGIELGIIPLQSEVDQADFAALKMPSDVIINHSASAFAVPATNGVLTDEQQLENVITPEIVSPKKQPTEEVPDTSLDLSSLPDPQLLEYSYDGNQGFHTTLDGATQILVWDTATQSYKWATTNSGNVLDDQLDIKTAIADSSDKSALDILGGIKPFFSSDLNALARTYIKMKANNADVWKKWQEVESKWAGFNQLNQSQKDQITAYHIIITRELQKNRDILMNLIEAPPPKAPYIYDPQAHEAAVQLQRLKIKGLESMLEQLKRVPGTKPEEPGDFGLSQKQKDQKRLDYILDVMHELIRRAKERDKIETEYAPISEIKEGRIMYPYPIDTAKETISLMEAVLKDYQKVGKTGVHVWDDLGAAFNVPVVPGLNIPRSIFEKEDFALNEPIGTLAHESAHRIGHGFLGTGLGGHDADGYMKSPSGRGTVEGNIDSLIEWAQSWINKDTGLSVWDEILLTVQHGNSRRRRR